MSNYTNNNDYSVRATKGQAYNNAAEDARVADKMNDFRYVMERFLYHHQQINFSQKATPEQIASALDNPNWLKLAKELEEVLK